jgi:hypothetical protein
MVKLARLSLVTLLVSLAAVSARAQLSGVDGKPQFIKVSDRVYCATGYALGNVTFVVTDKSLVVIVTTESTLSARRALDEIRKEVAELTIIATEKVARKSLDADDQKRLIEEALSEVDFSAFAPEGSASSN